MEALQTEASTPPGQLEDSVREASARGERGVCLREQSASSTFASGLTSTAWEGEEEDSSTYSTAVDVRHRGRSASEPGLPSGLASGPALRPKCTSLALEPQAGFYRGQLETAAKRQGCGLGGIFEVICRRLFRSDLVEYDFGSLEKVADLGHGTFGRVSLVRCRQTGQCLALKAMSKGLLAKRKLQSAARLEKLIMKRLDCPFVTRLAATFNREQHLYILMEAARGGDLHEVYFQRDLWGLEEHAQFYTACVVLALEYMHERRVMYRDLKMENVVLDVRGYAKLCDFGLSRFLWPSIGSAYTVCGTPEYKAPEINKGAGYSCAVDWWALGVLLYELMIGTTPFLAESAASVHRKACEGIDKVIPEDHDCLWARVVRGLCRQVPHERLPLLKGGISNLQGHAWFLEPEPLDWAALRCRRAAVPFVPELEGAEAVGHFNARDGFYPEEVPDCPPDSCWHEDYEDPLGPRLPDETEA